MIIKCQEKGVQRRLHVWHLKEQLPFTIQMWKELNQIGGRSFAPSAQLGIDGRNYNDHND